MQRSSPMVGRTCICGHKYGCHTRYSFGDIDACQFCECHNFSLDRSVRPRAKGMLGNKSRLFDKVGDPTKRVRL